MLPYIVMHTPWLSEEQDDHDSGSSLTPTYTQHAHGTPFAPPPRPKSGPQLLPLHLMIYLQIIMG